MEDINCSRISSSVSIKAVVTHLFQSVAICESTIRMYSLVIALFFVDCLICDVMNDRISDRIFRRKSRHITIRKVLFYL